MESMKFVRSEVTSMVDLDFFLNEQELNIKQEDDRIAEVIRGKVYERTKQKINDFITRCENTLAGFQERVSQTEAEFNSLVNRANRERPGSTPTKIFLDKSDANSVNKYNEKINRYNNQVELHRRIVDQANRAKERYEDAVSKFEEKKADIEEQIRMRLEELKPALDQDILTLLGKLQQLAYDNIRNKDNQFAGFLLGYLTKKAYVFLYDYIDSTTEQRASSEIFKKLNDEVDLIINNNGDIIKEGLRKTVDYLYSCYYTNCDFMNSIQGLLNKLPYDQCRETRPEIERLLVQPVDTNFEYKQIIDPNELNRVEEEVKQRKSYFEKYLGVIDELFTKTSVMFENIHELKINSDLHLNKMIENKSIMLDPFKNDIFFTLGFFDDEDQERYMKKHKQWLQNILLDIQKPYGIELKDLLNNTKITELLTVPAKELISTNEAVQFYSNKEKLTQKKNQYLEAVKTLNNILEDISELPKQKSLEFSKKMSLYMYLSLLPLVNVGVLYSILSLFRQYIPAFKSSNSFFVDLKNVYSKKFAAFCYICGGLAAICLVLSFLFLNAQLILIIAAATYLISAVMFYLKSKELNLQK